MVGQATYPSEQFPGYPSVSLTYPDGWSPLPTPGAPLAVARDSEPGAFRANVVVAIARLEAGQGLDQVEATIVNRFAGLADFAEIGRESSTIDGRPGFRIEGSFAEPQVGTLVQAVRVALVEHDGVTDIVQLTGSCTGTQVEEAFGAIRAIQESVTIR